MNRGTTRRRFLQGAAATATALAFPLVLPSRAFGANDRLNIAAIGCGGKGEVDTDGVADQNLIALCDIDDTNAANTYKRFSSAKRFKDYRVMLEEMDKSIDAVTVSTPDHHHAPAALRAMRMGKHVYCQKPLTHTVHEARLMRETAREKKVATQMGNQGHSHPDTRRLIELVRHGVLGKVTEVHVWTDRPAGLWPQGMRRPTETVAVPPGLEWDLFLGPAPQRPYHPAYHPFKWRGFWDFGTGALGDMACHCMDLAFFALDLPAPSSISARSSAVNEETAPKWSIIEYQFPAEAQKPPVKMTWYDGGRLPPAELIKGQKMVANGIVLVGDKDTLYVPGYWGDGTFLSGAKTADFKDVPQSIPRAPGEFDKGHYNEWINACRGGPKAMSNFDYSGPMAETVLLGNVALRAGQPIEWDAKQLKVTNLPEANRFVRKEYRKGWEVEAT
jgi:predicted dehydrogenase